ncbi:Splicing factor U2AF 26 kDa subunit [Dinochytrium kinnereticum]|nr:Splicing factor U2AF 26 kDa subunit [Dinochytrium kinnereticum]
MFMELAKFGEIEELNVCDNVGDHLVGNVYVRYKYEEDSAKAVDNLNQRFYAGRPLYAELSPVTDFGEACCRQYENGECTRGGFCNFMHLKVVSRHVKKDLFEAQRLSQRELRKKSKSPEYGEDDMHDRGSRDRRDRDRDRDRDDRRDRDRRDRDRDRGDRDRRDRDRGDRDRERSSRRHRGEDDANGDHAVGANGSGNGATYDLY